MFIFAYISSILLVSAVLPQLLKSNRENSTKGLSWLFLFFWFLGNISGAIFCLWAGAWVSLLMFMAGGLGSGALFVRKTEAIWKGLEK